MDIQTELWSRFGGRRRISRNELVQVIGALYHYNEISTVNWRIHDLKNKGIVHPIGEGYYTIEDKRSYIPEIRDGLNLIYRTVKERLPYTDCCVSDTRWFNEFMNHQVFRTFLVVEVEKSAMESVFHLLFEKFEHVYQSSHWKQMSYYISEYEDAILVKQLISEAPKINVNEISLPSIEKLLVDCYADDSIYGAQHHEIDFIFRSAFDKYIVNISTLRRYARRRHKLEGIEQLIAKTSHDQ